MKWGCRGKKAAPQCPRPAAGAPHIAAKKLCRRPLFWSFGIAGGLPFQQMPACENQSPQCAHHRIETDDGVMRQKCYRQNCLSGLSGDGAADTFQMQAPRTVLWISVKIRSVRRRNEGSAMNSKMKTPQLLGDHWETASSRAPAEKPAQRGQGCAEDCRRFSSGINRSADFPRGAHRGRASEEAARSQSASRRASSDDAGARQSRNSPEIPQRVCTSLTNAERA